MYSYYKLTNTAFQDHSVQNISCTRAYNINQNSCQPAVISILPTVSFYSTVNIRNFKNSGSFISSENTINQEISNSIQAAFKFYCSVHQLHHSLYHSVQTYLVVLTYRLDAATLNRPANSISGN